tara:strand:+ start:2013 stop:2810 length:798 start_codon:yes stop_codon:yes gene_type:complete
MFGNTFYHGTLRKYVVVFGNMFNGVYVQRFNSNNERIQTLKVPIAYGPKEKFLVRLAQDPNLDQDVAVSLPRIGFEMTDISYASIRKLPSTQKNFSTNNSNSKNLLSQYRPVPYDINFQMSIFVKNADDGTQILEQILPYFQPEWTNSINLIPEMNLAYDVPCTLNSVTVEDTYEGDFSTRRALIWNLSFTMKGYIFGPVSTSGVIKRATVNYSSDVESTSPELISTTTPGLTSGGVPTSNTARSVSANDIDADDDYGFARTLTE